MKTKAIDCQDRNQAVETHRSIDISQQISILKVIDKQKNRQAAR